MTDSNVIYGVDFQQALVSRQIVKSDGCLVTVQEVWDPSSPHCPFVQIDTSPSEYVADSGDCA